MLIKLILTFPLLLLVLFFFTRLRNQIYYRLFFIAVAVTGVFFVLNPDVTTDLAHRLGVGRGTDLILYLSVLFFFMFSLLIYGKLRKMESVVTNLARHIALTNAQKFPK